LAEAGKDVLVVALSPPGQPGTNARDAYDALVTAGVSIAFEMPKVGVFKSDWVIDGIFGIGLNRAPSEGYAGVVERINKMRTRGTRVLSLDVPSGIDALTGEAFFPAVVADVTLTFLAHKPGLWTGPALDYIGECVLLDLDIPSPDSVTDAVVVWWTDLASGMPTRLRTAHKGSNGLTMVVGGSDGMIGAALLTGRAALSAGAGKSVVGLMAQTAPVVDPVFPELMLDPFTTFHPESDVVVLGPGLGTSARAKETLVRALNLPIPVVLDADALSILAADFGLKDRLRARNAPTLATPHPGEAARILNTTADEVNADRISAARTIAEEFRAHVVLKGAGSVCVSSTGATTICASGNPLLATAGSGDVLAGMIGALLAQGMQPYAALVMAVAWHGHLADRLSRKRYARITASDLIVEMKKSDFAH
jgi:ADP-dependent NAD(P)H-hydrate dehydratase / NAD(P)H-hydrate epimerase